MGIIKKVQSSKFKVQSFTLIETIIVVAITGLIMPVVFAIFFVILQQQAKIMRLQEVKRQGDFVLSTMKTTIRNNATEIYSNSDLAEANEVCNSVASEYNGGDGQNFYIKDKTGTGFRYYLSGTVINYSTGSPTPLTNSKVKITTFLIKCSRKSVYSPPIVSLSIVLEFNSTSLRPEENATLTYNTNIKLKSF